MKHTALLTGPYDWDPQLLPLAEFEARLLSVRRVLADCGASALMVHGHSGEHGELAYLTGFVPKLGPAFALVPTDGAIRILVSGGPSMLPSAKLLTWVEDVRPIGDLKSSLSDWLAAQAGSGEFALGLWGERSMAQRPFTAVSGAARSFCRTIDLQKPLDTLRIRKSPRERELLRRASQILRSAASTLAREVSGGARARSAALAAERVAFSQGAQDVRCLASARDGGPPQPFDGPSDISVRPLLACIAVRFAGYWAERLVTVGLKGGALASAEASLSHMLQVAHAGVSFSELARVAARHLPPYATHLCVASAICNSIGLSLNDSPDSGDEECSRLEPGGVYVLRAGAAGERDDSAIVSAMIAVNENATEVLWSSTDVSSQ